MKLFGKKHITTKELRKSSEFFLLFFIVFSVGILLSHSIDVTIAVSLSVLASVYGILTVVSFLALQHRIGLELQCEIAGVKFEDFCTCKFHRNLKEEEAKGQSKLE